jgi:hypothetical protein
MSISKIISFETNTYRTVYFLTIYSFILAFFILQFGEIIECRVLKDQNLRSNKGVAFVQFNLKSQANNGMFYFKRFYLK